MDTKQTKDANGLNGAGSEEASDDGDQIWFTQWPSHSENSYSVFYDDTTPDQPAFVRTWQSGEPLDPQNIPRWLILEKGQPAPRSDLFSIANGVMIVSERLAEILSQFNLGPEPTTDNPRPRRTDLHPLPLFAHDERTLLRKVVLLQCSAHQDCFVPEETIRPKPIGSVWSVQLAGPHRIAARPQPPGGLDFWRDPRLLRTWFCSDRLYQAMKAAGIKPLEFHPCRMVD